MPEPGVPRLEGRAFVAVVRYGDIVVWHDTFAEHWFKANVTTDLDGPSWRPRPREALPFTFNCDIATPMVRRATRSWPSSCSLTCWSAAMASPRGCTTNGSSTRPSGRLAE
jgi:hypothetical protein